MKITVDLTVLAFLGAVVHTTATDASAGIVSGTPSRSRCNAFVAEKWVYFGSTEVYEKLYEDSTIWSFIQMQDCSRYRCGRTVMLDEVDTDEIPSQRAQDSEIISNPYKYYRERLANRTDIPNFLKQSLLIPFYDRFCGPGTAQRCMLQSNYSGFTEDRDERLVRITENNEIVEEALETGCWIIAERVPFQQVAAFYWAFFGYASFGSVHVRQNFAYTGRHDPLFTGIWMERAQRVIVLTGAYATPLTFCLLLFALYVIRKSLHVSDSHVYHYHKALTCADILMAFFLFLKESYLFYYAIVPLCLVSPAKFVKISAEPFLSQDELPAVIMYTPILTLACFASTLQAMLAVDRLCACYFPMFFKRHASTLNVKRTIFLAIVLNSISLTAELWTDVTISCIRNANCFTVSDQYFATNGQLVRLSILIVSVAVQLVCCLAVFVKMAFRYLNNVHRQSNQNASVSKKLVPFYLLLGTCALSMCGTVVEILYILSANPDIEFFEYFASFDVGIFCQKFRIGLTSAGNTCGLFVHLLVSGHCRAAAREGLAQGFRKVRAVSSKTFVVPVTKCFKYFVGCAEYNLCCKNNQAKVSVVFVQHLAPSSCNNNGELVIVMPISKTID